MPNAYQKYKWLATEARDDKKHKLELWLPLPDEFEYQRQTKIYNVGYISHIVETEMYCVSRINLDKNIFKGGPAAFLSSTTTG